jgi:hypothetical protein
MSRTLVRYSSSFSLSPAAGFLEAVRVVEDEVEERLLGAQPHLVVALALLRRARAEEPLEDEPRVGLRRHRRRRRLPGDVVLVGARVAGVAVARLVHGVAGELERREPRDLADVLRRHLVDRHADVDVAAVGLPGAVPVRNVAFARAWSPPPSLPGSASWRSRPPTTWNLSLRAGQSGCIVRPSV